MHRAWGVTVVVGLMATAGCDGGGTEPTDGGALADAGPAMTDAGPMTTDAGPTPTDAGPMDVDAGDPPMVDGGFDAGPMTMGSDCAETFALAAGRYTGRAGLSPGSAGPAAEYLENMTTYDIEITAEGVVTIEGTLMGDLVFDTRIGTLTCTVTPTPSVTNLRMITWTNDAPTEGRALNLGYADSLMTFTTFSVGIAHDITSRGAALFFSVTRVP